MRLHGWSVPIDDVHVMFVPDSSVWLVDGVDPRDLPLPTWTRIDVDD